MILDEAMRRALALATTPGSVRGENPRVGCVVLDADGIVVGEGWHRGAGTAHAEVDALAHAGERARGGTAVVTLEPCRHVGRTGPCTRALIDAGVARVVYAQPDPTPEAGGGARELAAAGIEVVAEVLADEAADINRGWTSLRVLGRPFVTVKCAMSLDGRVADASGGPTAITGAEARQVAHRLRGEVDAIAVGTGTVLADDPHLTARLPDGTLAERQPLRVAIGERAVPAGARMLDAAAPSLVLRTRNLDEVMAALAARGIQELLVEGGPGLSAALLDAGLADALTWFIAPRVLAEGPVALPSLSRPRDVAVTLVERVGEDVLVVGRLARVR